MAAGLKLAQLIGCCMAREDFGAFVAANDSRPSAANSAEDGADKDLRQPARRLHREDQLCQTYRLRMFAACASEISIRSLPADTITLLRYL